MKVFVSGGTGFFGGHLLKALRDRGHEVRLLVHRRKEGEMPGIELAEGDVTRPETLAAAAGCDAVINLVGIIREFPGRGVTFEKLHVEATRNMVAAARTAGVRRYLQMSSLGTRPGAVSAYHRTKFRAEEEVRGSGLDWTVFRPSIIYGPKDTFVNMLAGYIRTMPAVPVVGDGRYRLQPVFADDVARCFALSLEMPETVGGTYELCGPDRLSYDDLLDAIGRVLGRSRVIKVHNPLALMKAVVTFLQGFSFFPLTMDQITMLVEENICDGGWQETFRFEPEPFVEGISRYLRP